MRGRVIPSIIILCALGTVLWILLHRRASEPSYQGKPLSYWVRCLSIPRTPHSSAAQEDKAMEAIRHIGTNAFPLLLQWLCYDNSVSRGHLWASLPPSLRKIQPLGDLVFYSPKMVRAARVTRVFISLGPDASPALPSLAELFITTTNFGVRTRCWVILREIGAPSVPALATAAADKRAYTNNSIFEILQVLQQIGAPATSAVPALRILLRDAEPSNRALLSDAISHITGQPVIAPDLPTNAPPQ